MADKKWRPEGFINPHTQIRKTNYDMDYEVEYNKKVRDAFESGADAILYELRTTGVRCDMSGDTSEMMSKAFSQMVLAQILYGTKSKGTIVFIPDDD